MNTATQPTPTTASAWAPEIGSLAHRVCLYMQRNREDDDELSSTDIAAKFNVPSRLSVGPALEDAVAAGWLATTRKNGHYRAGPHLPGAGDHARLPAGDAVPSRPTLAAVPPASAASASAPAPAFAGKSTARLGKRLPRLDLAALPVRYDCPVPARRQEKGRTWWDAALTKLDKPGASIAGIGIAYLPSCAKAIQVYQKQHPGTKIVARKADDAATFGIWRTA